MSGTMAFHTLMMQFEERMALERGSKAGAEEGASQGTQGQQQLEPPEMGGDPSQQGSTSSVFGLSSA